MASPAENARRATGQPFGSLQTWHFLLRPSLSPLFFFFFFFFFLQNPWTSFLPALLLSNQWMGKKQPIHIEVKKWETIPCKANPHLLEICQMESSWNAGTQGSAFRLSPHRRGTCTQEALSCGLRLRCQVKWDCSVVGASWGALVNSKVQKAVILTAKPSAVPPKALTLRVLSAANRQ